MPRLNLLGAVERFAGQALQSARRQYQQLDRSTGGWLPGGGTASPLTPAIKAAAARVRDDAIVPALDQGLRSGVVPPATGMYARFLSGTSKPLTSLPPKIVNEINKIPLNAITEVDSRGFTPVDYTSYNGGYESPIGQTLGAFHVDRKSNEVNDRYDFNYYMPSNTNPEYTDTAQGVEMLKADNPRGLIPFAHQLGLIKPGSGYVIRAPLK